MALRRDGTETSCRVTPTSLLFVYCLLVVSGSLVGGWLPGVMRLTHTRLQVMMSAVAGLMLGVALLHLLPHAVAQLGSLDAACGWALAGLLGMFFLVRAFHFHHHGECDEAQPHQHHEATADNANLAESPVHAVPHVHAAAETPGRRWGWLGIAIGLALHTLLDGVALAASVRADSLHAEQGAWVGLGTFLAVLLHKPLDALSITTLMTNAGRDVRTRQAVNAAFALMCPLGAVLFYFSVERFLTQQAPWVGAALAFTAGVFLCISLGDLLPELQFHDHDRLKLSAALLLGVALAYGIGWLEPRHAHPAAPAPRGLAPPPRN